MFYMSPKKVPNANPIGNKVGRKATAVICILTIITLVVFTSNFCGTKTQVRADSVKGIGVGIY
jgi:hypothetical protein